MAEYQAGVCNINVKEVQYRRNVGYGATLISVVMIAGIIIFDLSEFLLLLVAPILFVGILGFLQAKNTFCVSYGSSGQQNAAEGSAKASDVANAADKAKDKAKSQQMLMQAALLSVIVLGIAYILT